MWIVNSFFSFFGDSAYWEGNHQGGLDTTMYLGLGAWRFGLISSSLG